VTPLDTNWKKGSGATPVTIQDLLKWNQFSIPTAPTNISFLNNHLQNVEAMHQTGF